jgi:hypothetical protein
MNCFSASMCFQSFQWFQPFQSLEKVKDPLSFILSPVAGEREG